MTCVRYGTVEPDRITQRYTFGGFLNRPTNSALSTEGKFTVNLTEVELIKSGYIPCNVYKDGLHLVSDIDEGNDGRQRTSTKTLLASGVYIPRPRLSNMHWYRGHSQALTSSNGRFSARNSCFDLYVGLMCLAISPTMQ